MNLPPFCFSDRPVPPSKSAQRVRMYDLNKNTIIPVVKDAFLHSIRDLSSLSFKYALTASTGDKILRPLSTCLPLGSPNRVANLQDICSGTLPFAVQAQQWLRESATKRPIGRPGKAKKSKKAGGRIAMDEEPVEVDDGENSDDQSESPKTKRSARLDIDSDPEMEDHGDVDPLLPFGNLASIPDFRNFKPFARDRDIVEAQGKRATVHGGFYRLPPLNSPVNWWYSGGSLSYLSSTPESGIFFHAGGSLTRLAATSVILTDKQSFQRVRKTERIIEPVQLKAPIYQIESQFLEGEEEAFIYARLPDEIVALRLDTSVEDAELTTINVFPAVEKDYFTHICPSQYISGEFLTASHAGLLTFRTLSQRKPLGEFSVAEKEFKKSARYGWTGCYFGAHPRDLCVATPCAVEVFDGRTRADNTRSQLRLLAKGSSLSSVANDIVAATLFTGRDSYHVMVTTKETVVVDSRFAKAPVLRYPSQATTSPTYVRTLTDSSTATDIILTGSQMSQQVMCFEVDLAAPSGSDFRADSTAARLASIPFLSASPRQLIPQIVDAELRLEFTAKQRLEKPIIGMEGIIQAGANGFTIAVLTALGDLFLQSFEAVDKTCYDSNGTCTFSTVHSDVKLGKKEKRHLKEWLLAADGEVMDPTMRDYVRPFVPDLNSRIGAELTERATLCAAALSRRAHQLCRRCNPSLIQEERVDLPDETCPRCKAPLGTSRVSRSTGGNRFCFVEENNSTSPIQLPKCLQREDRLREMGLTNRIVWKILTKCYGEDIPSTSLQPETQDMPPSVEKRKVGKSVAVRQEEMMQALLQDVGPSTAGPSDMTEVPPTETQPEPMQLMASLPTCYEALVEPMATSTQNPSGYEAAEAALGTSTNTARKAKKAKRLVGF